MSHHEDAMGSPRTTPTNDCRIRIVIILLEGEYGLSSARVTTILRDSAHVQHPPAVRVDIPQEKVCSRHHPFVGSTYKNARWRPAIRLLLQFGAVEKYYKYSRAGFSSSVAKLAGRIAFDGLSVDSRSDWNSSKSRSPSMHLKDLCRNGHTECVKPDQNCGTTFQELLKTRNFLVLFRISHSIGPNVRNCVEFDTNLPTFDLDPQSRLAGASTMACDGDERYSAIFKNSANLVYIRSCHVTKLVTAGTMLWLVFVFINLQQAASTVVAFDVAFQRHRMRSE
ncbi:hypothetical protein LZ32DRAFT_618426 [Colletotrichum eremochloae]|nr:hypothetical protein LZ32DRAFT_618426 [Colletotrichum eremochloae]